MKLTLPLTGTVLTEGSVHGARNLAGDPADPIRLVDIDLGNVSWKMVDVDLDAETMTVEVESTEEVEEPTGETDDDGNPVCIRRPATATEKAGFLNHARQLVEGRTKDELYALSKSPRLKRPAPGEDLGLR